MNLGVKSGHVQWISTGVYFLLADPELDSDFLGDDFSAAGFAAGVVVVVPESFDSLDPVELELVDSDFGLAAEAELSADRESVR